LTKEVREIMNGKPYTFQVQETTSKLVFAWELGKVHSPITLEEKRPKMTERGNGVALSQFPQHDHLFAVGVGFHARSRSCNT
jgi:hypothetical protein